MQICISPIDSERALSRFFLLNSVPFLFLSTQTLLLSQYSASLSLPFLLLNLPYISDWTYSNPPSFLILSSASFVFFANLSKPASPSTCFYSKSASSFFGNLNSQVSTILCLHPATREFEASPLHCACFPIQSSVFSRGQLCAGFGDIHFWCLVSQSVDKNSKNEKKSVNPPSSELFSSLSTLGWPEHQKSRPLFEAGLCFFRPAVIFTLAERGEKSVRRGEN